MRKKMMRAVQAVAFFALLFACIAVASRVLMRKESLTRYSELINNPGAYDVVFLGDSHGVNAVQPLELWNGYGISSFNMSNYGNTMAVSYWMLQNAIACGLQPKLVVIDMDDVGRRSLVPGSASEVHTALDAFPLTRTKIAALEDLMSDPDDFISEGKEGRRYVDIKWEYYFPLGLYHERWSELTDEDFHWEPNIQRGAGNGVEVATPSDYDIIEEYERGEGTGFGYEYLMRIISECQERGIDVLLVHYPFPCGTELQRNINAVWPIAEEYGVDFIDFVAMDSVVDYETDCMDTNSHLNPSGARKVTDFLGRYITEHYDIPDRRGGSGSEVWDADYQTYANYKLSLIRMQWNAEEVLMLLHDAGLSAVIAIPRDSHVYDNELVLRLAQNVAREHVYEEDAYSMWSNDLYPLAQLDAASAHGAPYLAVIDRTGGGYADAILTERLGVGEDMISTGFGSLTYHSGENGQALELNGEAVFAEEGAEQADLRVAVIDNRTGEVAAVMTPYVE